MKIMLSRRGFIKGAAAVGVVAATEKYDAMISTPEEADITFVSLLSSSGEVLALAKAVAQPAVNGVIPFVIDQFVIGHTGSVNGIRVTIGKIAKIERLLPSVQNVVRGDTAKLDLTLRVE